MREWLGQARSFALGVLAVGWLLACNSHHGGDHGTSETHFLRSCSASCQDGYSCLCGVCTLACDGDAVCKAQGSESATCGAPSADRNECSGVTSLCDMRCASDGDCRELGAEFGCESGRCRAPMAVADAGAAAGRGAGSGGRSGAGGRSGSAGTGNGSGGTAGPVMDAGPAPTPDAGGTAGAGSATCELPAESGPCLAAFPRYYHDTATGSCREFTYGGCAGNANNFETLAACEAACGGSSSVCDLPAVTGPCEALIRRYYHDAATDSCREFTYGGCQGNGNNFETPEACLAACGGTVTLPETACEVNGTVYRSGTDGIDDPTSCNTCLCNDGQLICTEINCPEPCPAGTKYAVSCSQCGPADGCEILRSGCLPICETDDDCTGNAPGSCFDGICRILCG